MVKISLFILIAVIIYSCVDGNTVSDSETPSNYHTTNQLGKHIDNRCDECHTTDNYTEYQCIECHQTDYDTVKIPHHIDNYISTDCYSCHTMTEYHLKFHQIDNGCIECHRTDIPTSNSLTDHIKNQFTNDCSACHDTLDWFNVEYSHLSLHIRGEHKEYNCNMCHLGEYVDNSNICFSCHQGEDSNVIHTFYQSTTNCYQCHKHLKNWNKQEYTHSTFAIEGEHTDFSCGMCHFGIQPEQKDEICIFCHREDFETHHLEEDPTDCFRCHDLESFSHGK